MNSRMIELKKWLIDKGLTQRDIAKEAEVSPVSVHHFCRGFVTSAKIKAVFEKHGCPEELLEKKVA